MPVACEEEEMTVDRLTVLTAMIDQGVIPVFYHPDVEVCQQGHPGLRQRRRQMHRVHQPRRIRRACVLRSGAPFRQGRPERDHGRRLDRRRADRRRVHRQRRQVRRRPADQSRRRQAVQPPQDRLQPGLRLGERDRLRRRTRLRDRQGVSRRLGRRAGVRQGDARARARGPGSCRPAASTPPKNR